MKPTKFISLVIFLPLIVAPFLTALVYVALFGKTLGEELLYSTILQLWTKVGLYLLLSSAVLWGVFYWILRSFHAFLTTQTVKWALSLVPILSICALMAFAAKREPGNIFVTRESIVAFFPLLIICSIGFFKLKPFDEEGYEEELKKIGK
ncbi:hypothetical protein LX64_03576 [Chitinophaga skermanii]|uniref:Uncharacterized protein n=1 Tax=Chitinophaga skermanii TaxID=331697 RepID=A0A327QD23_9BACT|nr:hypothetical protein [Chitinophaga skermanii]RAJ02556.1 hypothetical protein LX64_03576 [Chitinophaga skermanii]